MARAHTLFEALEPRRMMAVHPGGGGGGGDMVLRWNEVAMNVLRADTTLPGPGWASRSLAMTSVAVFDAVNSIEGGYAPYLLRVAGHIRGTTAVDAAVASAAHDVLVALYPAQEAAIDAQLQASLATVPDGPREARGVALGRSTAAAILAARANDGSGNVVSYTVNPGVGHWSPDPLNPGQTAWGPGWGDVTPFALQSPKQVQAPPPPALTSAEYAESYDEVKSLGAKESTTRTPDQTEVALFWAYDAGGLGTPPGMYCQQVAVIAKRQGNTPAENARLFALANIAQADTGIAAWHSKFTYDLWRPVTAIRRGDDDGNPLTVGDESWEPLGAPGFGEGADFTPPFPAYVSGHATFGAAVYRVLADYYQTDRMRFTLYSDEMPGVTRSYTRLSQADDENALSRVYMGVHWDFDATAGQQMGRQIADLTFRTELTPLRPGRGGGGNGGDGHHVGPNPWNRFASALVAGSSVDSRADADALPLSSDAAGSSAADSPGRSADREHRLILELA